MVEGPRDAPWLTSAADWKQVVRVFETREPAVAWLDEVGDEAGGG